MFLNKLGRAAGFITKRHVSRINANLSTAASQKFGVDENFQVGQKVHGYTVQRVEDVPEFSLTAILLKHDKTAAEHLHIARDDTNNVFGVAFRTTPRDDTGVPHILEHTVLCGSRRFPVRDPFFKMLNRSLATFMNAFTSMDWTMYPFSSQNEQDYYNLLAIYLDAAFFPRLRETDFRQEGWRLEHEDVMDPTTPIVFKGIVFNEMKGVFSNPQNLFSQKQQNLLLPSHTYGSVYGGDPAAIPDLTWNQLREFHNTHYHPSNTRFYTYGSLPLSQRLAFISENALDKFDGAIAVDTQVPLEPQWSEPRCAHMSCAPDTMAPDPGKQTTVTVSFLLTDITDVFEATVLGILGHLLVGSETAPFYRSLIEANIGSDFAPVNGYDGNTRQATFSVGLQGVHNDDVEKVKVIIEDTIDKVVSEGFEEDQIAAVLHTIELSQKHQSTKFGLNLGINVLPTWIHDGDPVAAIKISDVVAKFKQRLHDNPRYLQDKVKHYLKDNRHRLTLVMSPDEVFESSRQQREAERLGAMVTALSEEQRRDVYTQGLELASLQAAVEDLSCLPSLRVDDINRTTEATPLQHENIGGVPVTLCEQPTNGVTYFRAVSSLAAVPGELQPYVPLFCHVLTKMGTTSLSYADLSQRVALTTGGLDVSVHVADDPSDPAGYEAAVLASSYCLQHNVPDMFALWTEVFTRLDLSDRSRLHTLVLMSASELSASLSDAGHQYAMGHAAAALTPAARLREAMGGLSQVGLMKRVAESGDLDAITHKLQQIAAHVLNANNIRCSLNAVPAQMSGATSALEGFLAGLPRSAGAAGGTGAPQYTRAADFAVSAGHTHVELPFQVNFVSRSVRTAPYTHPDFAALRVLARLMTAKHLHTQIREKGGAYGGGAAAGTSGLFNFYSYRDPSSLATLAHFDGAVSWVQEAAFSQRDLDEAKLSTFAQVDAPVPPGSRGQAAFLHGLTDARRQQHRDHLFRVTADDVIDVAARYLSAENRVSSVCFLGPVNSETKSCPETWTVKTQL